MADSFANGLNLTAPVAAQCGRTFSRWLVEWLTQICGWTIVDNVSGNWTPVAASGTAGVSVASYPHRFDIGAAAYNFTSADIGSFLTITGVVAARFTTRNGIYKIRNVVSSKIVELDSAHSVHEDGFPSGLTGLSWRLWSAVAAYVPTSTNVIVLGGTGTNGSPYTFHLHITVRATNSYFPEFRMSPFASWNSGTHSWNDSRYTSALGVDNWNSSLDTTDSVRVWAAGDSDRVVIMMRVEDNYYSWHMIYLGEIDPKVPAEDPYPCIIWTGSNRYTVLPSGGNTTLIGYGSDSSIVSGGRWLAADDLTTVTGYAMILQSPSSADANWISDTVRWWGERTRARYRQPIICESRTTNFMELRGTLRRVWATARDTPRLLNVGINGEFLHVFGGILFPWCNSKSWYARG